MQQEKKFFFGYFGEKEEQGACVYEKAFKLSTEHTEVSAEAFLSPNLSSLRLSRLIQMDVNLSARGEKESAGIGLTKDEFAALFLAAEGRLKKSSAQKKEVICSLLVKMVPAIGWFSDIQPKNLTKNQPTALPPKKLVKAG